MSGSKKPNPLDLATVLFFRITYGRTRDFRCAQRLITRSSEISKARRKAKCERYMLLERRQNDLHAGIPASSRRWKAELSENEETLEELTIVPLKQEIIVAR